MELFYSNNINENLIILDSIESKHCIKVLRKSIGDTVNIVDGRGTLYKGTIESDNSKECHIEIFDTIRNYDKRDNYIHIAISPIKNNEQFIDKNNVKVVFNKEGKALYFSREAIPSAWLKQDQHKKYMQVGVIAFSDLALRNFNKLKESSLEIYESIDMNRVLENGGDIYLSQINYEMIGVDCENDLKKAEELMKLDPIYPLYNSAI